MSFAPILTLEEMDSRYEELVSRMDDHVSTLSIMQRQMETELRISTGNVLEMEYPITSSDDSDSEIGDYHYLQDVIFHLGIPRVTFNDEIVEIEDDNQSTTSIGTVRNDSTPFDYIVLSDEDSDDDTIVPEWKDPARSPDVGFIIRGRNLSRIST